MLKKLTFLEKYEQQAAQRAYIAKVEAEEAREALERPSTPTERIARALRRNNAQTSLATELPDVASYYRKRRQGQVSND